MLPLNALVNARVRKHILQALVRIPNILKLYEKIHSILQTANNLLEAYEESKKLGLKIVDSYDQFLSNDYAIIAAGDASRENVEICLEGFQLLAKHQLQFFSSQEYLFSKILTPKKTFEEEFAYCNRFWKDFHSNVTFSILK